MAELRLTGLLCVGSRDRQRWVQVPAELRALIQEARDGPAVTDGLELF